MHYDSQHNPNAGENNSHYSSGGSKSGGLSSGVQDGLSHAESFDSKNAEGVTQSQRPKSNSKSCGKGMKIGY